MVMRARSIVSAGRRRRSAAIRASPPARPSVGRWMSPSCACRRTACWPRWTTRRPPASATRWCCRRAMPKWAARASTRRRRCWRTPARWGCGCGGPTRWASTTSPPAPRCRRSPPCCRCSRRRCCRPSPLSARAAPRRRNSMSSPTARISPPASLPPPATRATSRCRTSSIISSTIHRRGRSRCSPRPSAIRRRSSPPARGRWRRPSRSSC